MNKEPTKEQICETLAEKLFGYDPNNARVDPMARDGAKQYYMGYPLGHDFAPDFFTDLQAIDDLKKKLREKGIVIQMELNNPNNFVQLSWRNNAGYSCETNAFADTEGEAIARAVYAWLKEND